MDTGLTNRHIIFSLTSLVLIFAGLYWLFSYLGLADVQAAIERSGIWAPLVFVLAKASTIVIAPLSGSPLYPLAGALFGFWKGSLLLILGDTLGGTMAFFLSRAFGRRIAERMMGEEKQFLAEALRMMGTVKGFAIARFCFLPAPEIVTYGAGLTRLPFLPFFIINTFFNAIPALILAYAGSLIGSDTWWLFPLIFIVFGSVFTLGAIQFKKSISDFRP